MAQRRVWAFAIGLPAGVLAKHNILFHAVPGVVMGCFRPDPLDTANIAFLLHQPYEP